MKGNVGTGLMGNPSTSRKQTLPDRPSALSSEGNSSSYAYRTEEIFSSGYSFDDTEDCQSSPSFRLWIADTLSESTFEEQSLAPLAPSIEKHSDLLRTSTAQSYLNPLTVGSFLDKPAQDALAILKGKMHEDTRKTILTTLKKIEDKKKVRNKVITLKDMITDRTAFGLMHTINRERRLKILKAIGIEEKEAIDIVNKDRFREHKHLAKLIEKDKRNSPLYGHDSLRKVIASSSHDERFSEEISRMINCLSDRNKGVKSRPTLEPANQPQRSVNPNSANNFSALDSIDVLQDIDDIESLRESILQSDSDKQQAMDELTRTFQAIASQRDN